MSRLRRGVLLAGLVVGLLVAAVAVVLSLQSRGGVGAADGPDDVPRPGASAQPPPTGPTSGTSTTPAVDATEVLSSPEAAAAVGAGTLLAAGRRAATGPWSDLGHPHWSSGGERPVYVVDAGVDATTGRVEADVVIASRVPADTEEIVLRLLPAAAALGSTDLRVRAAVDGRTADVTVDREGARLLVARPRPLRGGPVTVRIGLSYRIPSAGDIVDDGGPAGFGLLARSPEVTTLGHWLPLLTLPADAGPMLPWGDVGAFPAAVWSVRIRAGGTVVTGGEETACPEVPETAPGCVWARGVALRDVSAVIYPRAHDADREAAGVQLRVVAPPDRDLEGVLGEVAGATEAFAERLAPLAWRQVDTVAVPLGAGAAGMEFPGLSMIDEEAWDQLDGGFGTFVVVHEVAHQWFHALVGNGSLSSPVVDESLAQYLTVLYWRDTFGEEAAESFGEDNLRGRYRRALEEGVAPEPPAQPLAAFEGADAYGALIYGRSPLGWLAAEDAVGPETVQRFLAETVSEHGLGVVSDDDMLREAAAFDPALARELRRWWTSPEALINADG